MKKLSLLFLLVMLGMGAFAQETVYWRNEATASNWWDNNKPWYRSCDGWWLDRSDYSICSNNSTIGATNVIFDNNNKTSITVNGAWFQINNLTFASTASNARTLTADASGGLSFTGSTSFITNNSTATHVFKTGIGVDGTKLTIDATSGSLTFDNEIYVNANALVFTGSKDVTVNGEISGSGSVSKDANTKLTFSASNSLTGSITVNEGTLELKNNQSSALITVKSGATLLISENASLNNLTIESGGTLNIASDKTLTINAGKQVTINGTVNNNSTGKIKLLSDVNGTATLTGDYSGPAEVQQYLSTVSGTGKTDNWWYISTPVTGATSGSILVSGKNNKFGYYNETTAQYPQITATNISLNAGTGYLAQINTTDTYAFSGTLNNGDVGPITLTRTVAAGGPRGFNLIGNPYPSYIDWNAITGYGTASQRTDIRPTIWYRTRTSAGAMSFDTFDGQDGTSNGVRGAVNKYIAPLQAFWVKVNVDGTTPTIQFTNLLRSHQDQSVVYNRLKAPAQSTRQILHLKVTNGINSDETIISTNVEAKDGFDFLDSEKMFVNSVDVAEIYSFVDNQELVINKMQSIEEGKTVTLGFRPGQAGTFTIEATQLDNIDAKVVLVDKVAVKEQELTAETPYTFMSDETPTNDRFLIKLVSKVPTGVENTAATGDLTVYINRNNRIQLICGIELNDLATVSVYNIAGQKLSTQKLSKATAELNGTYNPGVYMIQLTNGSQAITKKLIIR